MSPTEELGEGSDVRVSLTDDQARWLGKTAAASRPPVDSSELLGRLVDDAIAKSETEARLRTWQLDVYQASGYPEHHPDYPDFPQAVSDA